MKYAITTILLFLLMSSTAFAEKGTVVLKKRGCDYFLVQSQAGSYALLEWSGGHEPDKGDVLVGDFESYGSEDLWCLTDDEEVSVYVEDYWLSRRVAIEKLYEKCE